MTSVVEALETLTEAAATLTWLEDFQDWPDDGETLVAVLLEARRAKAAADALTSELTDMVCRGRTTGDRIEFAGNIAEVRWSNRYRRWDFESLRSDLRQRILYDEDTGEVRTGSEVLELVLGLQPLSGSLRVGVLKKRWDVDPDEYAEKLRAPSLKIWGDE